MIMTAALLQKIISSFVILTTVFLSYIVAVYYDLTRPIGRSIFQLVPTLLFFGFGLSISILFKNPKFLFQTILPIKSGFARSYFGDFVLPYVGTAMRTMSIIASLSAAIDKMWFYWLNWRIHYLIRLLSIICLAIIAGNVIFKMIFVTHQSQLSKATSKLNIIGAWSASTLGIILLLLTILAIPKIFAQKDDERNM